MIHRCRLRIANRCDSVKLRLLIGLLSLGCMMPASGRSPIVVAHRGSSHQAPENTIAAFRLAWEEKSDGVEGDFYLTADGEIVCIHDKTTERTAGRDLEVEKSTLSQLRQLDAGRWKDSRWDGEKIPTFEEVFKTVPDDKLFVIELKSKSAIVPVLAKQLERLDTSRIRILIITFDQASVRECKRLMPQYPVHWLTSFKRSVIGGYRPTAEEVAKTVKATGAEGVGMKGMRKVIDAEFVADLKRLGCDEFHVWTIDSVADAHFFQGLGAIGITTNRPALIGPAVR